MGPSSNLIVVFIRGEQTQETVMQREDCVKTIRGKPQEGRDGSDVPTSQGLPALLPTPGGGTGEEGSSPTAFRESMALHTP